MNKKLFKKVVALALALIMVFQTNILDVFAMAFGGNESYVLSYEELTKDDVSAETIRTGNTVESSTVSLYKDTDIVRVLIVMEKDPALTLSEGDEFVLTDNIIEYRQELADSQEALANDISAEILGGKTLEVVWNLTLAANAISANIEYGYIDEIEAMDGVAQVVIEAQFQPMTTEAGTNNVISQDMTGALLTKNESGYSGAGRRIAVIDTGTDTDHQSFNAASYEYALSLLAKEKGMTLDAYKESLNLLTIEKIEAVLDQLNCYAMMEGNMTAEDLYISSKLPFNFNYVDRNYDVTHDNDEQGSHGSHVAGIAAANSYISIDNLYDFDRDGVCDEKDALMLMKYAICDESIKYYLHSDINGDGKYTAYDVFKLLSYIQKDECYIKADETVALTGVASEAQLLSMKVFGAAGGAYTSDYMAATEDAIVLGCDVANLSLGSAFAGFMGPVETEEINAFVNKVMDLVAESDMVMATAAGNAGNWADYSHVFFNQMTGLMYADEAGTSTVGYPATFKDTFAVASVENRNAVSLLKTFVKNIDGTEERELTSRESYSTHARTWNSLDAIGKGTTYELVFVGDPTNLLNGKEQTDLSIYAGSTEAFTNGDYKGKIVIVARGNEVVFTDKHKFAEESGAAAVIIFNNLPSTDANGGALYISVDESEATIPCTFISLEEAIAIYEMSTLDNGLYTSEITIREKVIMEIGEGTNYVMSDFSSWGATGTLEMKPEITAPGGEIYSINGEMDETNGYEVMSGTSMSTPHISGLVALADQYFAENDILKLARELTGNENMTMRELAQSMLMSTAMPIIEQASGVEYSIRNQGAGLAQIQNVVNAESFILVDGQTGGKVKAELGDGTEGWTITFTIYNITDEAVTYNLDASVLTTDVGALSTDYYAGLGLEYNDETLYFAMDEMVALGADVAFTGEGVKKQSVTVAGKDSVTITVSIDISDEVVAAMEKDGFTNGFYVEGFVYVTPEKGVQHSIPMLGWYGNWSDPSMYDSGNLFDYAYGNLDRPSHMYTVEKNMLTWTPAGADSPYHYTGNIYGGFTNEGYIMGDARYLEERNAINSTGTSIWNLYAIYPTLIRNAGDCKIEVRDSDTGELYFIDEFDDWDTRMMAGFYYHAGLQWYDTTFNNILALEWDYTDLEGDPLVNGTNVTISLLCLPEYYIDENGNTNWEAAGEGAELSYKFTVDNETPELADVDDPVILKNDGDQSTLSIRVQDNEYIAAVILLTGSADTAVQYYYPDMDVEEVGKSIEVQFDMDALNYRELYGNKATIVVCDYAGNESYYSINLNGEGEAFGDFVGFQYDSSGYINKWVSFDANVNKNETGMFGTFDGIATAEYVNGYVFMQTNRGELYAVSYEDMLANEVNFETTYVATLEQVYQDIAYDYNKGRLVGLYVEEHQGEYKTIVNAIPLESDEENGIVAYSEEYLTERNNLTGYTIACHSSGTIYVLGIDHSTSSETASLWKSSGYASWGMPEYYFQKVGDTGLTMDYAQSMTFNHNDGKLYWSRFDVQGMFGLTSELLTVNISNAKCEKAGELSGETACLMAPLTEETAAKDEFKNVPAFDRSIVGTPILNTTSLTLSIGKTAQLTCDFDPWYTAYKDVVWTSSDPTVATVEDGLVTALKDGMTTITVASAEDPTLTTQCSVLVSALTLQIEGLVSYTTGGLNNISNSKFFKFNMVEGEASMTIGDTVTAPIQFEGYGLKLAAAVEANGYIWACEHGNSGMIYKINKSTGKVVDMLQPIDGDMMFGLAYSKETELFTGIMNFYLYVDQPLTKEAEEDMLASWDKDIYQFTWHKINMSEYLNASQGSYVTNEDGHTGIVFCGVTNIDYTDVAPKKQELTTDYLGAAQNLSYTPVATMVLLDNIGRLWYIDEMTGWILEGNNYKNPETNETIPVGANGVFAVEYEAEAEGKVSTYSVFVIRTIDKTPLFDKYMNNDLGITYHFSSIHFAGWKDTAEADVKDPMFIFSTYDYWGEAATNELYLCIPGQDSTALYELGNTGFGYLVAPIFRAKITSGLNFTE